MLLTLTVKNTVGARSSGERYFAAAIFAESPFLLISPNGYCQETKERNKEQCVPSHSPEAVRTSCQSRAMLILSRRPPKSWDSGAWDSGALFEPSDDLYPCFFFNPYLTDLLTTPKDGSVATKFTKHNHDRSQLCEKTPVERTRALCR